MDETIKLTEPQHKFIFSRAKFPALVGGLGSGKSQGGTYRVIKLMTEDVGISCAYYFPTYDLIKLRGIVGLTRDLELFGIDYSINKSEYTVRMIGYGDVIFRSYDSPERIVAYEVAHSVVDELDTLPADKAEYVWRKVVERNRQQCNHEHGNTVGCVTTPDQGQLGFVFAKWGGELQEDYELIKASTYSNPFLPPDYIDNILKNYNKDLAKLYLEGEFVSLRHRTVFDKDAMAKALLECYSPIKHMVLENGKFVARKDGYLKVWSEPKAGMTYVIGADISEGLIDGDYSSATVLDKQGYQVAQYHGHIAPDLYGKLLIALGKMYNSALLIPECNNHGLLTATVIRDSYYPYLYVQKSVDDGYTDSKEQTRVGWLTTRRTKPLIIDTLSAALRDGTHGICDKEVIKECQTYIINDDGSYGAQRKCNDDRVMSYAIAFYGLRFI